MVNTNYLVPCLIEPIPSSAVWAGIFVGIDAAQYGTSPSIRTWGLYAGGLWTYHAMICPMEAIHGRRSSLHNVAAGGMLGYIGVSLGKLGVPFVSPYTLYNFRNPALIGGAVYGAMAGAMATLGGKPM
eukprot:CAMPEP_0201886422 /NCGR_PEP_ID=MMETSP0902-20130614/22044_1 /ASSEMBLY_ACC=CAM_ASM_000551 /TAXON_ID=420261 /ORGANISM="Thalassiosira antarctica, Strain CCMP982" /LENGTH=127 /DNA_ID=CAMNT_0048415993 /DNA_START=45 /DNA_END=428 /DNA_ORIENTATION=-